MKRTLAIVLTLVLAFALPSLSSFASAEGDVPQFTAMVACNTNTDDLNENPFLTKLAEEAGVSIKYDCVYTDWSLKLSTTLASGDLPDAFFGWQCLTTSDVVNNMPLLANLTDLISDDQTPNISAALQSDNTYKNAVTDLNGQIYFLSDRMPFRPETYTSILVNKTWLDTLGLSVPETIEDFENMLIAFRDQDPNQNGEKDELPMYIQLTGDDAWSISGLMGAFGCSGSITSLFALDGDKVVYQPLTDNFKQFMIWIAHLREEGLMPAELATADWSQYSARLANDTPIVGVTNAWDKSVLGLGYADQYIAIAPFAGPNGDRGVAANAAISCYDGQPKFVMSAACENKEALMHFVDMCFIPENAVQCFYGPIGTVLQETDDGLVMVDPPEGMDWNSWKYKYAVNGGWPLLGDATFESLFAKIPESDSGKLELVSVNEPYENTNTLPTLKFTEDESNELSIIQTDVDTYVNKMIVEWFANGGVEEGWDSYLNELDKMQVQRYIEIYQTAYDRQK